MDRNINYLDNKTLTVLYMYFMFFVLLLVCSSALRQVSLIESPYKGKGKVKEE